MPTESGARGADAVPPRTIPGVERVLAVASGKGGVGKSTVAVNLALGLNRAGARVGLLDADIYGPSAPLMLGIDASPQPGAAGSIRPVERFGIQVISMGFFLTDETPVVWRGPLAMSATRQFLRGVEWGSLDYLVVDLPPGTGDIALTLAQEVPLAGGVVVTTPQDVALADVRRGVAMLRQVKAPVIGIIENMTAYVCERCGTRDEIFGSRPRAEIEAILGAPVLAEIPLVAAVCRKGDAGTPLVVAEPGHPVSVLFVEVAARVRAALAALGAEDGGPEPAEIERSADGRTLHIRWTDGHVGEYPLSYLRGWCPCAQCQGHGGGRRYVHGGSPELESWEPVGRYAVTFRWRDGHATGIYSHVYLRELCACHRCRSASQDPSGASAT
jgi:ATP-binding protein involved in chromosome partitioning